MAMASSAIGQRPYPLILDPEPPRYLQSLSGSEPPPSGRSSRRCGSAPLSTAPRTQEGRSGRRATLGGSEPPPRASRPARPLRPGLQQRLRRRPGAPRPRDVRSIFEQPQDPRVPAERGEGHCFAESALRGGHGWCDLCGREVLRQALRCASECEGRAGEGRGRSAVQGRVGRGLRGNKAIALFISGAELEFKVTASSSQRLLAS